MFDDACYYATLVEHGDYRCVIIFFCSLPRFIEMYQERHGTIPRIVSLVAVTSEEAEDISNDWDDHFIYNGED